ncbi:FadR/GntR family transcriptional regulator [Oryzobacter telluris]|uniref:FadR/GntR family transcriptional regulator n=1 Tax=Oryzobacter telluris TaxID=3149179 RepID=UPI00370DD4F0
MDETVVPSGASLQLGPYAAVFAPLDAAGRAEAVTRRLGDSIAFGLLPDASPLPPESDLAERFGVATTTVREALSTLRADGLIRTRRGRGGGSFVCAPADGGRAALLDRLRRTGIGEWRDLADHYATVSGGCARLAAHRADDADVARLEELASRPMRADRAGVQRLEGQFHVDLAATAQSARLTREEMSLQGELGPLLWLAHTQAGSLERAGDRHRAIAAAVRDGDADRARAEAETHVGELFGAVRTMVLEARRSR